MSANAGGVQVQVFIPAEQRLDGPVEFSALPVAGDSLDYKGKRYRVEAISPGPFLGSPLVRLAPIDRL